MSINPTIRSLQPNDMMESMRLSQFAFQYELGPEELRERLERLRPEDSLGLFLPDGQLAAKLTVLPLEVYVGGAKLPMGGVAGVATWPEHRRGGKVRQLLHHALERMKEKGQTLSMLHPFQFEFYRRFGWETYVEYKKYELETAQLPRFPETGGHVVRTSDSSLLSPLYEAYASRFNGTLSRSPSWWEWNIHTLKNRGGQSAVYYGSDGEPKGYVLYQVKDQTVNIREWVALDAEGRKGLWNFIGNHDSMAKKVLLQAEAGDRLTSLLADPRIKQETVPYFMARLVDAKAFLEGYRFKKGAPQTIRLAVADPFASWNEGFYEVKVREDGTAEVRFERSGAASEAKEGLACGIGVLTAILLGYETPDYWQEAGRLTGSREAVQALEGVLPPRSTYLLDFF